MGARKLKPATRYNVYDVGDALRCLMQARYYLQKADCPKALARVRAAISSTQGALRHVQRRAAAK